MKCDNCDKKVTEKDLINESMKNFRLILCKEHLDYYNKVEFGGKELG